MRPVFMFLRTWKDMQLSTALIRQMIPSVIPSRSAICRARSSFRCGRLRVFTWSKEMTGRPASVTRRRALLAMRSVVALA